MGKFDQQGRWFVDPRPTAREVMVIYRAMHAEEPGSEEHEKLLKRFSVAARRMNLFQRALFVRLHEQYHDALPRR